MKGSDQFPIKIFVFPLFLFLLNGCSQPETSHYLATYSLPCGRSVLTLEMEDKELQTVSVIGDSSPLLELNEFVLSNTTLEVTGYFTGESKDDQHCGSYPEFVVTKYKAAGSVSRCTTYGDIYMDESLILFSEELPENELAPIDYKKNTSLLKTISPKECREVSKNDQCLGNETLANSCDQQEFWCCKK